jgi:RHS repeat-associated protein
MNQIPVSQRTLSRHIQRVGVFALFVLLLAAPRLHAATVNLYEASNGFLYSYDDYWVDASFSVLPGTPNGTYYVEAYLNNGDAKIHQGEITVEVKNGAITSPLGLVHIDGPRGTDLPAGVSTYTAEGSNVSAEAVKMHTQIITVTEWVQPVTRQEILYVSVGPRAPTPSDATAGGNMCPGGSADTQGMARYTVHSMLVSLHIEDTPVGYTPPRGPAAKFTVSYNERESQQPATFDYSNLGPKWTFNWLSYVTDDPATQRPTAAVYVPGGGAEFYSFNSTTQTFAPHPQSHATLVKVNTSTYERRFADGSKDVYALADGASSYPRRVFLTQRVDAAGVNAVTLGYDSSMRITTLTDALGQVTTLSYDLAGDSLKITKVMDPFQRYATFEYTNGQLTKITDELQTTTQPGIQSVFDYTTGTDSIKSLTTPYGPTNFTRGETGTNRWIETTDPLGGKERVEFRDQAPNVGAADAAIPVVTGISNSNLDLANTFYWSKKAMADGTGAYTEAKITHWLYNADGSVSGIPSSEKQALESRVWYTYTGQADGEHIGTIAEPSQVARLLGDGTTQLSQSEYNTLGKVTKATDPVGRVISYVYGPLMYDLLEVRQTRGTNNKLLRKLVYNSKHEPLTDTDAAGQTTTYTYNSQGQILTRKNAKNEITTYSYGGTAPVGYLESITGPAFNGASAVTWFTYDTATNRVSAVKQLPDDYTVTIGYDNLDRKSTIAYPDGSSEQFLYTDTARGMTLDLTASKDRRDQWTYRHYDANRHMDWIKGPLLQVTAYDWCSCGSLNTITDARGKMTGFRRDIEGRLQQKVFDDHAAGDTTQHFPTTIDYVYDVAGRLQSTTDAKNQRTNYLYYRDDTVQQISYSTSAGGALTPPTPTVNYTYDPNYRRIKTVDDTVYPITYNYNTITSPPVVGAGLLAGVDQGGLGSSISFTYDELGRQLSETVDGVGASVTYDALGRIGTATNPLGQFTSTFDGPTPRLQNVSVPNGLSVTYTYFPVTTTNADRRLQTIQNNGSGGALLSKFDYQYDEVGQITHLTKQLGATGFPVEWSAPTNGPMYDGADQLINVMERSATSTYTTTSYTYDPAGNPTTGGSTTYNNVNQITNAGYTYDLNGNLTADAWRTYEWDAANRLTAINYPPIGDRTEFTYNGAGQRVKIVEKTMTPAWTVTLQPTGTAYASFSNTVSLAAGNYTLALEGLNPNGGENTALVDIVKVNGTLVGSGSFEAPPVAAGTYAYRPTGGSWVFAGQSGISTRFGAMAVNNPTPPQGTQVGFLQNNGAFGQTLSFTGGSYTLTLSAAQRANANGTFQQVRVSLYGQTLTTSSTKLFIWSGTRIAEERDAANTVTRRYYRQGEQRIGGTDAGLYYYTRDYLGSIREMTDSTGVLRARYDYDPFGNTTKVAGDLNGDFGYTGHYRHAASNLYLAPYRAYDPSTGRWISRDPIGERGGTNLYGYVLNNPIDALDPLGLSRSWPWSKWDFIPPIGLVHGAYEIGAWPTEGVIAARDTVNLAWDTGKKRSCELTNLADGNGRVTTLGGDSVNENLPDIANGVANIISDMPGTSFNYPPSLGTPAGVGGTVLQNAVTGAGYDQVTTPPH